MNWRRYWCALAGHAFARWRYDKTPGTKTSGMYWRACVRCGRLEADATRKPPRKKSRSAS